MTFAFRFQRAKEVPDRDDMKLLKIKVLRIGGKKERVELEVKPYKHWSRGIACQPLTASRFLIKGPSDELHHDSGDVMPDSHEKLVWKAIVPGRTSPFILKFIPAAMANLRIF